MSCIITVFNPLNISSFQNVDKAFEPKLTSWDKFFDFFRKIIFGADETKEAQLRKIYGYISSEDNRIAIKNGFSDLINSTPYDYKNKFNITVDWNKNGTVIKLNYANSLIKQINLTAEERDLDDFFCSQQLLPKQQVTINSNKPACIPANTNSANDWRYQFRVLRANIQKIYDSGTVSAPISSIEKLQSVVKQCLDEISKKGGEPTDEMIIKLRYALKEFKKIDSNEWEKIIDASICDDKNPIKIEMEKAYKKIDKLSNFLKMDNKHFNLNQIDEKELIKILLTSSQMPEPVLQVKKKVIQAIGPNKDNKFFCRLGETQTYITTLLKNYVQNFLTQVPLSQFKTKEDLNTLKAALETLDNTLKPEDRPGILAEHLCAIESLLTSPSNKRSHRAHDERTCLLPDVGTSRASNGGNGLLSLAKKFREVSEQLS